MCLGPIQKGHKINLGGHEMINGLGKKKSYATQMFDYSLQSFCELFKLY